MTLTAIWQPNDEILKSSVTAILKATIDTLFLGPTLGLFKMLSFGWEVFLTRQTPFVLTGWISCMHVTSEYSTAKVQRAVECRNIGAFFY